MTPGEIISLVVAVFGFISLIIGVVTMIKSNKKDNSQYGQQQGMMLSDLGYIKSQNEEIKQNQIKQNADIASLKTDVAVLSNTVSNHISDKSIHTRSQKAKINN